MVDQLAHTRFDSRHVVRRERALKGDIVIEAFFDDRADDHFGSRVQLLDRMANQVSTGVANDLEPLLVLWRDDLQAGITLDQVASIDQLAVDLAGHGGLGQTGTNGCSDVCDRHGVIERALTTVGKSNGGHGASSPSGDPYQRSRGLG